MDTPHPLLTSTPTYSIEDMERFAPAQHAFFIAATGYDSPLLRRMLPSEHLNSTDERGRTAAMMCAGMGRTENLRLLIQAGCTLDAKDNMGKTMATFAVQSQSHACLRLLIDAGCDINAVDMHGWTCFHWAVIKDSSGQALRMLFDAGVNLLARNNTGQTAMSLAAAYTPSFCPLIESLLEAQDLATTTPHALLGKRSRTL